MLMTAAGTGRRQSVATLNVPVGHGSVPGTVRSDTRGRRGAVGAPGGQRVGLGHSPAVARRQWRTILGCLAGEL